MSDTSGASVLIRQDPLLRLAGRLLDPADRESYAELIVWLRSLPATDEMVKLAQILGFMTLIARDLPDALAAEKGEIRELIQQNVSYHRALDERLSKLPDEIGEGIDVGELAEAMSESFRQQLAQSGLGEAQRYLAESLAQLKNVARELDAAVAPIAERYRNISQTVEGEITRLTNTAAALRRQSDALVSDTRDDRSLLKVVICALLLMAGFAGGAWWEKATTRSLLEDIQGQVSQLRPNRPSATEIPAATSPDKAKRKKKGT